MEDKTWIYKVFLLTFILSCLFSLVSNSISSNCNVIIVAIILVIFIFIGIIFDMIGVAVLTSQEKVFLSLASQKIKGGKEGLKLLKNASKISSICNDVVGDICGIVSGSLGAVLSSSLVNITNCNIVLVSVIVTAFISSLTVGGKAIGKQLAVKRCDKIVLRVGKLKNFIHLS